MKSLYIGRFRLFHKGYLDVVKYILRKDQERLIIGIGASQQSHRPDNPFTGREREEMITSALQSGRLHERTCIIQIDESNTDYANWASLVERISPPFDLIYSNSELVRLLFARAGYQVEDVPRFRREEYSFDLIKGKILNHEPWEELVPGPVATFIKNYRLDERLIEISGEA